MCVGVTHPKTKNGQTNNDLIKTTLTGPTTSEQSSSVY